MSEHSPTKKKAGIYRQGIVVAIALTILSILEFYVALTIDWTSILMGLAMAKAVLVVVYFMHIRSVWSEDSH